jgi:hypothetical protein
MARQVNIEGRPAARLRGDANMAVGLSDQVVKHGKAQAGALANGLRGKKRLERLRSHLGSHTATGVSH